MNYRQGTALYLTVLAGVKQFFFGKHETCFFKFDAMLSFFILALLSFELLVVTFYFSALLSGRLQSPSVQTLQHHPCRGGKRASSRWFSPLPPCPC